MNAYCSLDQFYRLFDVRTMKGLSGDQNTSEGVSSTVQFLLDVQASVFNTVINGRYSTDTLGNLVAPIPLVVTLWVCVRTAARLFARRNDRPKQLDADEKWADEWIKQVMSTALILPGQSLSANQFPSLQDSDFFGGASQFDHVFGTPSPRAPQSANPGYVSNVPPVPEP